MATLTYVKGLPTPVDELNSLGFTEFEMFLNAYCPVFHKAACETANHLLATQKFNKAAWNTHLQKTYGINKRHANGVISFAQGAVHAATEHRKLHIKTLEGKLKSITAWITKTEKKLKDALRFYSKSNWRQSQTGCNLQIYCDLRYRGTNWQNLKFKIHNKKRRCQQLTKQIAYLKTVNIQATVPRNQALIVGSKDESLGNQVCQWDGEVITFMERAIEPKQAKALENDETCTPEFFLST